MSTTINPDASLLSIAESWPETVPVFVAQGFPQMADEAKRRAFGSAISLRQATGMKKLDLEAFVDLLESSLEAQPEAAIDDRRLRVAGLLPCPVRIPLEEAFAEFRAAYEAKHQISVEAELQAAAVGAQWMAEHVDSVQSAEELPELFISAGFETFFDPKGIGRFREIFADLSPHERFNSSFDGIQLKDPEGRYAMIAVVPAVFLVNTRELGDEPMPQSWADILDPRFAGRVSLPVGDFDLFSGILLDIKQRFGAKGVRALGRSLAESMHPAQMVKIGNRPQAPVVTIMPYFFTRMAKEGSPMQAVWPADGAIVSPIFLLAKKSRAEALQPLVDFFCSEEVAEILAVKGLFPSTHPGVDNGLAAGQGFSWLGWDYISTTDIAAEINECQRLFDEGKAAS